MLLNEKLRAKGQKVVIGNGGIVTRGWRYHCLGFANNPTELPKRASLTYCRTQRSFLA